MPSPDTSGPDARRLVVIAHGSRAEAANDAHRDLCQALQDRLGEPVFAAFLELAAPDLATVAAQAALTGVRRIDVLPFFLHPGNHTTRDIPELVAGARRAHPGIEIRQLDLFGADPAVIDLLADQAGR